MSNVTRSGDADGVILEPMEAQFGQVRSRDRVRDLAEVFTHQREVDAMLDLIPDAFQHLDVKFLEPASGSGNFLVEILRRKLLLVTKTKCVSQEQYEHQLLRTVASIYGVDISPENVTEARARLAHTLLSHYQTGANTVEPTSEFLTAAALIIGDNIVQGDTLNAADKVELCDWRPHAGGRFRRVWSYALVPEAGRDLFWAERVQDDSPVHFSGLAPAPAGLERGTGRENYDYAFIHGAYPTEEMKDMKFDVIVGNPPYQTGDKKNQEDRAAPIYQYFIEHAISLDPKYVVMIVPSRWFTGGFALDKFRAAMIADRRLRTIVDNPKVFDCFPDVEIMGGVNYFLWDRDWDGDCQFSTRINGEVTSTATRDLREGYGVLVRDNSAAAVIHKVRKRHRGRWCSDVCGPQLPFGQMRTNFSGDRPVRQPGDVALVLSTRGGYVPLDAIDKNHEWIDRWKVLLPMAYNGGQQVDEHGNLMVTVLGEPIGLAPGSACTQTYLIAGLFDSREETENFTHYLATKFVRFLVLQRKSTQHVYSDRFLFVPFLDMKRRWTDEDLYDHFRLSKKEIAYIEASIKPRSVNLSLDSPIPSTHLPGGAKYRQAGGQDAGRVPPEPARP